jgi:putative membrane protein
MKKYSTMVAYSFAAAMALVVTADAQTMNRKLSDVDQRFLKEAIEGDLAEINMGKLAQEKGQSQETKQFGQMLEQDHSEHLQKAKETAQQMGLVAPAEPNAKQKRMYDQVSKLSDGQFDKHFADDMVKDHKQDIKKYEKEAKSKGPLADFAQETIPTLQKHLQTAESVARQTSSKR